MLEHFFQSRTRLRQLRSGPLSEHIDDLAGDLRRQSYARTTARHILCLAGELSRFAYATGVSDAAQIDEMLVRRFLEKLACEGSFRGAPNAMRHVLEHLRSRGVIASVPSIPRKDPFAELLGRYDDHLHKVRGLASETREGYLREARRLLAWLHEHHGDRPIGELSGPDVLGFVTDRLKRGMGKSRNHVCSSARIFLRFLRWEGITQADLSRVVPRAPRWRLDSIPKHLPWKQVRSLLDSIDTSHPEGMRDRALLLLIAGLGLRNHDVRTLEPGHIDRRRGEIRLPRTKGRRERLLPLPQEIGAALADYLLHGRPPLNVPYVFIRHRAPQGPLKTSHSVGAIILRHLKHAGIDAPSRGARLLRHSLATRMVNAGVPIKEIADVLGHASIDTTAIYTKVDTTSLADVALPFPGGES